MKGSRVDAFSVLMKRLPPSEALENALKKQRMGDALEQEEEDVEQYASSQDGEEDEESVLELTREQLEEYRKTLGDDFEIVEAEEEEEEEEECSSDGDAEEYFEEEEEHEVEDDVVSVQGASLPSDTEDANVGDDAEDDEATFSFWNSEVTEDSLPSTEQGRGKFTAWSSVPSLESELQSKDLRVLGDTPAPNPCPSSLSSLLQSNRDVWISHCGSEQRSGMRKEISKHILRHVLNTRKLVLRNNQKVKKLQERKEAFDFDDFRDQGFTRPRVLVLCPFRHAAFELVQAIFENAPEKVTREISNRKRFEDDFGPPPFSEREMQKFKMKPQDFQQTFEGNIDDCFRFGMSFYDKSIRLFSDFYGSDIIIASPLGLRMVIGAPGDKKRDFDFLSSIEMLVCLEADVFSMQNFEHVQSIMNVMNLVPQESHGADFSRIRHVHLNNWSRFQRQTLVFSSLMNPDLNLFFNRSCFNFRGRIKTRFAMPDLLGKVVVPLKQVFQRFPVSSLQNLDQERFAFFEHDIFPALYASKKSQHLIFVSSYFDFVRVRNFLKSKKADFAACSEYCEKSQTDRARSFFAAGRLRFLVVTERFLFFRRHTFKNPQNLVFYSLPENPQFFVQLSNLMVSNTSTTSFTMFCKYDAFALERIVGSSRLPRLLGSSDATFMFC